MPDRVDEAELRFVRAAEEWLEEVAGDLLARAIPRTPMEESTLRGSGHVEPDVGVDHTARGIEKRVVFSTPYAAAQHEGWAIHPGGYIWRARHYTTPGTGPKFLENPLKEMSPRYEAALAAHVKRRLG
jgi:hypothetical protein